VNRPYLFIVEEPRKNGVSLPRRTCEEYPGVAEAPRPLMCSAHFGGLVSAIH
jgi:hypothetical protein